MDPKILNTDDNDKLNPMAGVRNYGAGTEDGDTQEGSGDEKKEVEKQVIPEDEEPVLPDEIAFPEEQEEADEMA